MIAHEMMNRQGAYDSAMFPGDIAVAEFQRILLSLIALLALLFAGVLLAVSAMKSRSERECPEFIEPIDVQLTP